METNPLDTLLMAMLTSRIEQLLDDPTGPIATLIQDAVTARVDQAFESEELSNQIEADTKNAIDDNLNSGVVEDKVIETIEAVLSRVDIQFRR